jgi:HSP20 family protein
LPDSGFRPGVALATVTPKRQEVFMNMRDLIPWARNEGSSSVPASFRNEEVSPFLTLHRDMNRLFENAFSRFETGMPSLFGRTAAWPSVEIVESDKEVRVSAELPGLTEKDVEVLVNDDVLTIRGEKKAQVEEKDRHFSERYYGRFERRIPLPFEVEDDRAEASFDNGVLVVALPKSPKADARTKRIAVKGGTREGKHADRTH